MGALIGAWHYAVEMTVVFAVFALASCRQRVALGCGEFRFGTGALAALGLGRARVAVVHAPHRLMLRLRISFTRRSCDTRT